MPKPKNYQKNGKILTKESLYIINDFFIILRKQKHDGFHRRIYFWG
jgi:hypothetical protein